ncbi:hypothetical protein HOG98_07550 [bacterium]|jgi:hypothetical protein|nr:hypothetical protein [bacterium]
MSTFSTKPPYLNDLFAYQLFTQAVLKLKKTVKDKYGTNPSTNPTTWFWKQLSKIKWTNEIPLFSEIEIDIYSKADKQKKSLRFLSRQWQDTCRVNLTKRWWGFSKKNAIKNYDEKTMSQAFLKDELKIAIDTLKIRTEKQPAPTYHSQRLDELSVMLVQSKQIDNFIDFSNQWISFQNEVFLFLDSLNIATIEKNRPSIQAQLHNLPFYLKISFLISIILQKIKLEKFSGFLHLEKSITNQRNEPLRLKSFCIAERKKIGLSLSKNYGFDAWPSVNTILFQLKEAEETLLNYHSNAPDCKLKSVLRSTIKAVSKKWTQFETDYDDTLGNYSQILSITPYFLDQKDVLFSSKGLINYYLDSLRNFLVDSHQSPEKILEACSDFFKYVDHEMQQANPEPVLKYVLDYCYRENLLKLMESLMVNLAITLPTARIVDQLNNCLEDADHPEGLVIIFESLFLSNIHQPHPSNWWNSSTFINHMKTHFQSQLFLDSSFKWNQFFGLYEPNEILNSTILTIWHSEFQKNKSIQSIVNKLHATYSLKASNQNQSFGARVMISHYLGKIQKKDSSFHNEFKKSISAQANGINQLIKNEKNFELILQGSKFSPSHSKLKPLQKEWSSIIINDTIHLLDEALFKQPWRFIFVLKTPETLQNLATLLQLFIQTNTTSLFKLLSIYSEIIIQHSHCIEDWLHVWELTCKQNEGLALAFKNQTLTFLTDCDKQTKLLIDIMSESSIHLLSEKKHLQLGNKNSDVDAAKTMHALKTSKTMPLSTPKQKKESSFPSLFKAQAPAILSNEPTASKPYFSAVCKLVFNKVERPSQKAPLFKLLNWLESTFSNVNLSVFSVQNKQINLTSWAKYQLLLHIDENKVDYASMFPSYLTEKVLSFHDDFFKKSKPDLIADYLNIATDINIIRPNMSKTKQHFFDSWLLVYDLFIDINNQKNCFDFFDIVLQNSEHCPNLTKRFLYVLQHADLFQEFCSKKMDINVLNRLIDNIELFNKNTNCIRSFLENILKLSIDNPSYVSTWKSKLVLLKELTKAQTDNSHALVCKCLINLGFFESITQSDLGHLEKSEYFLDIQQSTLLFSKFKALVNYTWNQSEISPSNLYQFDDFISKYVKALYTLKWTDISFYLKTTILLNKIKNQLTLKKSTSSLSIIESRLFQSIIIPIADKFGLSNTNAVISEDLLLKRPSFSMTFFSNLTNDEQFSFLNFINWDSDIFEKADSFFVASEHKLNNYFLLIIKWATDTEKNPDILQFFIEETSKQKNWIQNKEQLVRDYTERLRNRVLDHRPTHFQFQEFFQIISYNRHKIQEVIHQSSLIDEKTKQFFISLCNNKLPQEQSQNSLYLAFLSLYFINKNEDIDFKESIRHLTDSLWYSFFCTPIQSDKIFTHFLDYNSKKTTESLRFILTHLANKSPQIYTQFGKHLISFFRKHNLSQTKLHHLLKNGNFLKYGGDTLAVLLKKEIDTPQPSVIPISDTDPITIVTNLQRISEVPESLTLETIISWASAHPQSNEYAAYINYLSWIDSNEIKQFMSDTVQSFKNPVKIFEWLSNLLSHPLLYCKQEFKNNKLETLVKIISETNDPSGEIEHTLVSLLKENSPSFKSMTPPNLKLKQLPKSTLDFSSSFSAYVIKTSLLCKDRGMDADTFLTLISHFKRLPETIPSSYFEKIKRSFLSPSIFTLIEDISFNNKPIFESLLLQKPVTQSIQAYSASSCSPTSLLGQQILQRLQEMSISNCQEFLTNYYSGILSDDKLTLYTSLIESIVESDESIVDLTAYFEQINTPYPVMNLSDNFFNQGLTTIYRNRFNQKFQDIYVSQSVSLIELSDLSKKLESPDYKSTFLSRLAEETLPWTNSFHSNFLGPQDQTRSFYSQILHSDLTVKDSLNLETFEKKLKKDFFDSLSSSHSKDAVISPLAFIQFFDLASILFTNKERESFLPLLMSLSKSFLKNQSHKMEILLELLDSSFLNEKNKEDLWSTCFDKSNTKMALDVITALLKTPWFPKFWNQFISASKNWDVSLLNEFFVEVLTRAQLSESYFLIVYYSLANRHKKHISNWMTLAYNDTCFSYVVKFIFKSIPTEKSKTSQYNYLHPFLDCCLSLDRMKSDSSILSAYISKKYYMSLRQNDQLSLLSWMRTNCSEFIPLLGKHVFNLCWESKSHTNSLDLTPFTSMIIALCPGDEKLKDAIISALSAEHLLALSFENKLQFTKKSILKKLEAHSDWDTKTASQSFSNFLSQLQGFLHKNKKAIDTYHYQWLVLSILKITPSLTYSFQKSTLNNDFFFNVDCSQSVAPLKKYQQFNLLLSAFIDVSPKILSSKLLGNLSKKLSNDNRKIKKDIIYPLFQLIEAGTFEATFNTSDFNGFEGPETIIHMMKDIQMIDENGNQKTPTTQLKEPIYLSLIKEQSLPKSNTCSNTIFWKSITTIVRDKESIKTLTLRHPLLFMLFASQYFPFSSKKISETYSIYKEFKKAVSSSVISSLFDPKFGELIFGLFSDWETNTVQRFRIKNTVPQFTKDDSIETNLILEQTLYIQAMLYFLTEIPTDNWRQEFTEFFLSDTTDNQSNDILFDSVLNKIISNPRLVQKLSEKTLHHFGETSTSLQGLRAIATSWKTSKTLSPLKVIK